MIDSTIATKIGVSTCAVARHAQKHEDMARGAAPGAKFDRPESEVVGTAFVVRDGLVLTNRHIVKEIVKDAKKRGTLDYWYLEFVYPRREGPGWSTTYRRVKRIFALVDPHEKSGSTGIFDAGFLAFSAPRDEDFQGAPVEFGSLDEIVVGADIAVCGFPLGNALLREGAIHRFGPVLHAGMISGVAPYDAPNPRNLTTFLTDLNTAGGMSGSPLFTPKQGKVIGLHFAGAQRTCGCAVPVDRARVEGWIRLYEGVIERGEQAGAVSFTPGGDVIEGNVP